MKHELTQEALEARRKYAREWRRKHPEKVREYDARRWENAAARANGPTESQEVTKGEID